MNWFFTLVLILGLGFILLTIMSCMVVASRADRQMEEWMYQEECKQLGKK